MRKTILLTLAAAMAVGAASPALAGPLDDVGPGLGSLDYILEMVAVRDTGDVIARANKAYGPAGKTIGSADDKVIVNTEGLERIAVRVAGEADSIVSGACDACAPSLGGVIGPQPVGPVGDVVRGVVNRRIATINSTYAETGAFVNEQCGNCAPGLGGPIGPMPVGPVGEPDHSDDTHTGV